MLLLVFTGQAQEYRPDNKQIKTRTDQAVVLKNATLHPEPGKTLESAHLVIKNGRIIDMGKTISVPKNAVTYQLNGAHIYHSFIDVFSDFGIKKIDKAKQGSQPQYESSRNAYYWNDHIRPTQNAVDHFKFDEKSAKKLRQLGFGAVNTHINDGIIRGTGMLVGLHSNDYETPKIIADKTAQFWSFDRSDQTRQSYPNSIMGKMALMRQVYWDADWYDNNQPEEKDLSLEAFNSQKELPQLFHAGDYLNALRADKIAEEFNQDFIVFADNDTYKRIDAIKSTNARFILPLTFPEAYDMSRPYLVRELSLEMMKHWYQAPANAAMMEKNNIAFAFSLTGLDKTSNFKKHLAKAIKHGLTKEQALAALTTIPASYLELKDESGKLEKGNLANFIITDNPLFSDNMKIYENWILGKQHRLNNRKTIDITGNFQLEVNNEKFEVSIKKKKKSYNVKVTKDTLTYPSKLSYENNWMRLIIKSKEKKESSYMRLSLRIERPIEQLKGSAILGDGKEVDFRLSPKSKETAKTSTDNENEDSDEAKSDPYQPLPITFPNLTYGVEDVTTNQQKPILIKNATLITGEADNELENTDILLKKGKINKIGKALEASKAQVINASGKYVSAGIVDEHSHIAGTSINESGQNSSAEVKMEDALNPDDVSIYRALSGGVTTIQLLHGSANPIGGQSAILKLKWGASADEMLIDKADPFIKFALGENVKQSNWGSNSRFPQTRMGVEQVFIDYFSRAKAYEERKKSGDYRKDEELETLLEIINDERFISCHSYVQSEIVMLMRVAEQFDFKINTFTHILEGYKVADKMQAHGAGGSTFSDWWAYKYEVNDAIPFNAALMHEQGVVTAINSDDAEMMRRLNQEAAKSMKYGDVAPEDAWQFVTLNPAKLLHLDDRLGSLKEGKDADVVIWNNHPLSVYARAEKTIIEGVVYFDRERADRKLADAKQTRQFLINKLIEANEKGLKTQPIKKQDKEYSTCETIDNY
jgi:imidazolonepropionase-like amidohydrolase